jgi:hypothetical protein
MATTIARDQRRAARGRGQRLLDRAIVTVPDVDDEPALVVRPRALAFYANYRGAHHRPDAPTSSRTVTEQLPPARILPRHVWHQRTYGINVWRWTLGRH